MALQENLEAKITRCDFCSATGREGLVFYKGLLSALICSNCIKSIISLVLDNTINTIEVKRPENL